MPRKNKAAIRPGRPTDTAPQTILADGGFIDGPRDPKWLPDGRFAVAERNANVVRIYNPDATLNSTVPTIGVIEGLAFGPAGEMFTSCIEGEGFDAVRVIRMGGMEICDGVGGPLTYIDGEGLVACDTQHVWNIRGDGTSIASPRAGGAKLIRDIFPHPDPDSVYVADAYGSLWEFNVATNTWGKSWTMAIRAGACDREGMRLFTCEPMDDGVQVWSIEGDALVPVDRHEFPFTATYPDLDYRNGSLVWIQGVFNEDTYLGNEPQVVIISV